MKGLYYDANCAESRLPGWRSRLVTVPLQCFLPLEIQQEPKHQSHACFGLFQHSEKRAGTPNWPFFNGLLLLLLSLFLGLSSCSKLCKRIKVSCVAQRCGFVRLVAQLPLWGDVIWKADETYTDFCRRCFLRLFSVLISPHLISFLIFHLWPI